MIGNIKALNDILKTLSNSAKPIKSETVTLALATVYQLTVPSQATSVRIVIDADDATKCHDATKMARYWTSGITPTATTGFIMSNLDEIYIDGKEQMAAFKIIESDLTATGTEVISLNIQFYQE